MRRAASILLLLCFVALGTGAVEYLHNLQHAREDAALDAAALAGGSAPHEHVPHDESNCEFHAQLHVPLISVAWVPLLVLLGLFVAFLSERTPQVAARCLPSCLVCRGPPSR